MNIFRWLLLNIQKIQKKIFPQASRKTEEENVFEDVKAEKKQSEETEEAEETESLYEKLIQLQLKIDTFKKYNCYQEQYHNYQEKILACMAKYEKELKEFEQQKQLTLAFNPEDDVNLIIEVERLRAQIDDFIEREVQYKKAYTRITKLCEVLEETYRYYNMGKFKGNFQKTLQTAYTSLSKIRSSVTKDDEDNISATVQREYHIAKARAAYLILKCDIRTAMYDKEVQDEDAIQTDMIGVIASYMKEDLENLWIEITKYKNSSYYAELEILYTRLSQIDFSLVSEDELEEAIAKVIEIENCIRKARIAEENKKHRQKTKSMIHLLNEAKENSSNEKSEIEKSEPSEGSVNAILEGIMEEIKEPREQIIRILELLEKQNVMEVESNIFSIVKLVLTSNSSISRIDTIYYVLYLFDILEEILDMLDHTTTLYQSLKEMDETKFAPLSQESLEALKMTVINNKTSDTMYCRIIKKTEPPVNANKIVEYLNQRGLDTLEDNQVTTDIYLNEGYLKGYILRYFKERKNAFELAGKE